MQTMSIERAIRILDQCAAVFVDDCWLLMPTVHDDCDTFMEIRYEEEGLHFNYEFDIDDNEEVKQGVDHIYLRSTEGVEFKFTILVGINQTLTDWSNNDN